MLFQLTQDEKELVMLCKSHLLKFKEDFDTGRIGLIKMSMENYREVTLIHCMLSKSYEKYCSTIEIPPNKNSYRKIIYISHSRFLLMINDILNKIENDTV